MNYSLDFSKDYNLLFRIQNYNSYKKESHPTEGWSFYEDIYESAKDVDAVVVLTEWADYKNIEWELISKSMRKPSWIFDTRKCINYKNAKKAGFNIWEIGNSPLINK